MATTSDTTVVGFDLGHGESAVAVVRSNTTTAPNVLDLRGAAGRQHVTAVAVHPQHGVLVGEAAVNTPGRTRPLYLAFKGPELDDEGVRRPITLFVSKIREDIENEKELTRRTRWVFGAPSGWSTELMARYAQLLKSTGIADVEVVPESRAALLYARDSGEVKIEQSQLSGRVLVVDCGSSTTDFTAVIGMTAKPSDRGTELGASLIDKTIQRWVLAAHEDRELLESLLDEDQDERLKMELQCRKAKEKFFRLDRRLVAASSGLTADEVYVLRKKPHTVWVPIQISKADMEEVLATPQPALGGRSWPAAFREDLQDAATKLLGGTPDAVLLTGGASRMHFVLDIARELFGGNGRVLLGDEPEVAIARGLALAGRMGVRSAGFRRDVKKFLDSDQVPALVTNQLPALAAKIGEAAASGITEKHVVPAFRRWQAGEIRTLNQVAATIAAAVNKELINPSHPALATVIAEWQTTVNTELQELTRPICQRWHIESSAMALPPVTVAGREWRIGLDNTKAVTDVLSALAIAVNVVVAGVVSTLLLGGGIALIATTGPIGVILTFSGLVAAGFGAKDVMIEKALETDFSPRLRRLGSEKLAAKLRRESDGKESELAQDLARQLQADGGEEVIGQVTRLIRLELDRVAKDAELLIS
ncbi:MAG: Hsp70 family protein [Pseudonocardiaceae bacterium]